MQKEGQTVPNGLFKNFTSLENLDLSSNQLVNWRGNLTNELSRLMFLNISDNTNLTLPPAAMKLRRLKEISGVTWNEHCLNCMLVRNYTFQNEDLKKDDIDISVSQLGKGDYIAGKKVNCRVNRLVVSKSLVLFAKHGFFPLCLEQEHSACFKSEVQVTPVHRCWDLDNKILNVVYFTSPIALVLNLTVVLVSLTTKDLRRNVTMLLTSSMAASDLLVSVYSIILITARKMPYVEYLVYLEGLCNALGFMWLTGQIVTYKTSLWLTIERFLAIVYCMEPSVRITRGRAVSLIAFTWCLGLAVATLPLAKISVYTSNTYCVPIRPIKDIPHSYEMSIALSVWGMLVYFTIIPLYIKIFISVRKTSEQAGIRRDGSVAKKIAILVMSNMVFFFLPVVIGFLWLTTNLKDTMSPQKREILTGVIPTLLFSLNAFINPLLYAFRTEKFQEAIKMRFYTICLRKPRAESCSTCYSNYANSEKKRNGSLAPMPLPKPHKLGSTTESEFVTACF